MSYFCQISRLLAIFFTVKLFTAIIHYKLPQVSPALICVCKHFGWTYLFADLSFFENFILFNVPFYYPFLKIHTFYCIFLYIALFNNYGVFEVSHIRCKILFISISHYANNMVRKNLLPR